MRAFVVVLLACLAAVSAGPHNPERIIGGSVTTINQYPYAVALLAGSGSFFSQSCGASILNNRCSLTAAHCFMSLSGTGSWRKRVGSTWGNSGGVVHNSNRITIHPQFNRGNLDNDIALICSASTITHQSGSIAGANYNLPDNAVVWAIGWGRTAVNGPSSEQLRHVQIWTVNTNTCRQRYAELGFAVTDNMLCSGWLDVGGRDQCQGDSGGPLLHNGVIVGVCSWGHQCALARYPGVNARVSRFTAWIQNNA